MKKILSVILISVMAVCLAGCGSSEPETDEYGNIVEISGSTCTVYPEALPCTIDYDGFPIALTGIDYYEDYSTYTYSLSVIYRFDVSSLDDAHLYYLKTGDFDPTVKLTCEDNDLDSEYMHLLGWEEVNGEFLCGYNSGFGTQYRNSFAGSELYATFGVTESEGDITEKIIDYTTVVPDSLPELSEMDETAAACYRQWLATTLYLGTY